MVVDEKVTKAVHIKGYRRAVGMVLWATRRSFIENKYGVSICGSVMHKENDEAFDNFMWIIQWYRTRIVGFDSLLVEISFQSG